MWSIIQKRYSVQQAFKTEAARLHPPRLISPGDKTEIRLNNDKRRGKQQRSELSEVDTDPRPTSLELRMVEDDIEGENGRPKVVIEVPIDRRNTGVNPRKPIAKEVTNKRVTGSRGK